MKPRQDLLKHLNVQCLPPICLSHGIEDRGKSQSLVVRTMAELPSRGTEPAVNLLEVVGKRFGVRVRIYFLPFVVCRDGHDCRQDFRSGWLHHLRPSKAGQVLSRHPKFKSVGSVEYLWRDLVRPFLALPLSPPHYLTCDADPFPFTF